MQPIDIRHILATKAPGKRIPGFVIRYLERIVHVEEINRHLAANEGVEGYDFLRATVYGLLNCRGEVVGLENIPTDGRPYVFASNHPLGGLDGMLLALSITIGKPIPHTMLDNSRTPDEWAETIKQNVYQLCRP